MITVSGCTSLHLGLDMVTLTGKDPENRLRRFGDLKFYVPCDDYGLVEISHMALLHSVTSVALV